MTPLMKGSKKLMPIVAPKQPNLALHVRVGSVRCEKRLKVIEGGMVVGLLLLFVWGSRSCVILDERSCLTVSSEKIL